MILCHPVGVISKVRNLAQLFSPITIKNNMWFNVHSKLTILPPSEGYLIVSHVVVCFKIEKNELKCKFKKKVTRGTWNLLKKNKPRWKELRSSKRLKLAHLAIFNFFLINKVTISCLKNWQQKKDYKMNRKGRK